MKLRVLVAMGLATTGFGRTALAQTQRVLFSEQSLPTFSRTTALDVQTPEYFAGAGETKWLWSWQHPGETDFLRLHIKAGSLDQDLGWVLIVRDKAGDEVDRLTAKTFSGPLIDGGVWTKLVYGNYVQVELQSKESPTGLRLQIDRYNSRSFHPTEKAIVGQDKRVDLVQSYPRTHRYYIYSRPIAAVFFVTAKTQKESNCTGFLLAPYLLITNQHCISDVGQLRAAFVRFGYESDRPLLSTYGLSEIVAQDADLDFSLLRLDRAADAWLGIAINASPIRNEQRLILIQHPNGRPKQLAEIGCAVEYANAAQRNGPDSDFTHLCDSEGGSSGSPVMDQETGKVVGLHHLGTDFADKTKNANFAVRICLVLNRVRQLNPGAYGEIKTSGLVEGESCGENLH